MDDTLFFNTKSIGASTRTNDSTLKKRKPQTLLVAARHNKRKIQAELGAFGHIDPTRSHLNEILAGPVSPDGVVALAHSLMSATGYAPPRHDYVQAFELVFSLPTGTTINTTLFFNSCMEWTAEKFGRDVILSSDVHHDEEAPHMHVLVSPIAGGCYLGSRFITRMELNALRKSFAEMALGYGLREPVRRLHGEQRNAVAQSVIGQLEASHDPILRSALWPMIKRDIQGNPGTYAAKLGINIPEAPARVKKVKTLVELAVSPGKGPRHERTSKAIGFKESRTGGNYKAIGIEFAKTDSSLKAIGFDDGSEMNHEKIETIALLVSPKTPTASSQPTTSNDQDGAGLHVDDDGVIHGLDADRVSMGKPQTIPRQPSWHGIYCRHRLRPVGLFSDLAGLSRSTLVAADAGFMLPGSSPTVIRPQLAAAADVAAAAAGLMQGAVRTEYSDMATGLWDESLGEFVQATEVTHAWAASHVSAIKTATDPPFAMEPGDSYVERDADDIYQPNFLEPEEFLAWTD